MTPTPHAGPSTANMASTVPSCFSLLQEMPDDDNQWDSNPSSDYSDYDFNNDSDTVAFSIHPIFASGGKKKPKKKKGKGKATTPSPKMNMSSEVSQTPIQQQ